MIQKGMAEEADEIGRSLYDTIWNRGQLWFRTPEAWQTNLTQVRSPYYMRATTVWAVKQAYDARSENVD
jgi:non-lysosomal glucosylceramidase